MTETKRDSGQFYLRCEWVAGVLNLLSVSHTLIVFTENFFSMAPYTKGFSENLNNNKRNVALHKDGRSWKT